MATVTVKCSSCQLPIQSDVTPEEALAQERLENPDVGSVEMYCQVCFALKLQEYPDAEVVDDARVLGPKPEPED